MAIKYPPKNLPADQTRKTYGFTGQLGYNRLGKFALGLENKHAGTYRVDNPSGHQRTVKNKFYMQWKPRTENQLAAAQTFREGMAAWKALTPEEKAQYNEDAKEFRIEGVNLFMREWMRSH